LSGAGKCGAAASASAYSSIISVRLASPATRQNRSKISPTTSQPSSTDVFIPVSLVSASGNVAILFMELLPPGLNTPSLRLEGSSTTPHQMDFNIDRDIPCFRHRLVGDRVN